MRQTDATLAGATLFVGRQEVASYKDSQLDIYRGNPLIEALPPIWSNEQVMKMFMKRVSFNEQDRFLPPYLRMHLIQDIVNFFQPWNVHIDLEQKFSRMLRGGYKNRNITAKGFEGEIRHRVDTLRKNMEIIRDGGHLEEEFTRISALSEQDSGASLEQIRSSIALGFAIIGTSGVGKTSLIERLLSFYPQVIFHNFYANKKFTHTQVCWMKLECPHDGSPKGLCVNFFQALDTMLGESYQRQFVKSRSTKDELIPNMANIAARHSLGCLVIDEIQRLRDVSSKNSRELLAFFVQLANTIGIPIVLIGTFKAARVISSDFLQARRATGQGDVYWYPMKNDATWELFLKSVWRYQYVQNPVPLTEELKNVIYEESAGITDFAVKLFLLAQYRAITTKESTLKETLTERIIRQVARDSLNTVRPALEKLHAASKAKDEKTAKQLLANYEDLLPSDLSEYLTHLISNPHSDSEFVNQINQIDKEMSTTVDESSQGEDVPNSPAQKHCQDGIEATEPASQSNQKRTKSADEPNAGEPRLTNELKEIVNRGTKNKVTAYEALKNAGYIKNPAEFLERGKAE